MQLSPRMLSSLHTISQLHVNIRILMNFENSATNSSTHQSITSSPCFAPTCQHTALHDVPMATSAGVIIVRCLWMVCTVGSVLFLVMKKANMIVFSCTAPAFDLNGVLAGRRSHAHTECALGACTLQELWNNYGTVGDLVVSH